MPDFYGDKAGFQTYWTDRGREIPGTWDDDSIAAALLVASEWLDRAFINSFAGLKVGGRAQIREWPRSGVQDIYGYSVADDAPPLEVINATYEAAFRQLTTPGIFFEDYKPGKYRSAAIVGAVSVVYAIGDAYSFQTQMPAIGAILYPIIGYSRGNFSALSGGTSRV